MSATAARPGSAEGGRRGLDLAEATWKNARQSLGAPGAPKDRPHAEPPFFQVRPGRGWMPGWGGGAGPAARARSPRRGCDDQGVPSPPPAELGVALALVIVRREPANRLAERVQAFYTQVRGAMRGATSRRAHPRARARGQAETMLDTSPAWAAVRAARRDLVLDGVRRRWRRRW